jgi:hypothetical protein
MTTPVTPTPGDEPTDTPSGGAPGVEIGMTEDGGTFEPEEEAGTED